MNPPVLSSCTCYDVLTQSHLKEKSCVWTLIKVLMHPPLAKPQDEVPYDAF